MSINSITFDEICAMEFDIVNKPCEFYYRYDKCKCFFIKKSDVRRKESQGSKITIVRMFVCKKHGLGKKKHLCKIDSKIDQERLTSTKYTIRFHGHYKAKKDRYEVSAFEETRNHELTPSRFVHLL